MKLHEVFDTFGKKSPSLQAIATKHNVDLDALKVELAKGSKHELEHTDDLLIANEIARDHMWEDPFYYSK